MKWRCHECVVHVNVQDWRWFSCLMGARNTLNAIGRPRFGSSGVSLERKSYGQKCDGLWACFQRRSQPRPLLVLELAPGVERRRSREFDPDSNETKASHAIRAERRALLEASVLTGAWVEEYR